jgi:hypothetical protein
VDQPQYENETNLRSKMSKNEPRIFSKKFLVNFLLFGASFQCFDVAQGQKDFCRNADAVITVKNTDFQCLHLETNWCFTPNTS